MSKAPRGSKQKQLNDALPIFRSTKLGDVIADLLAVSNNGMLTPATLAIHGAASPVVKTSSASVALVNGNIVPVAAQDLPVLAGTLPNGNVAAWAFYVNQAGVLSVGAMTTPTTTVALAIAALAAQVQGSLPQPTGGAQPIYTAMIGFIVVSNATGSNFVGNTTALDTGSLTVGYYNMGAKNFFPLVNMENRTGY